MWWLVVAHNGEVVDQAGTTSVWRSHLLWFVSYFWGLFWISHFLMQRSQVVDQTGATSVWRSHLLICLLPSLQSSSIPHLTHCHNISQITICSNLSSADGPWLIWNWNIRIELWIFYQPSRQLWHTITVKSKMLQEDQLSKLDLLHLWCYFSTDISADCIIKESPNVPRSPLFLLKRKGANIITKCQFQALGTKRFQTGPEPTSVTQTGFSLVCALKYFLR